MRNLYLKIKESKLIVYFYKTLLWGSVAYFLSFLTSKSNSFGGASVAGAVNMHSNDLLQIVGVLGIFIAIVTVYLYEIQLLFNKGSKRYNILKNISFVSGKISSIFLMGVFSSMSFVLGLLIYYLVHNQLTSNEVTKLINILILFIFIMSMTALLDYVAHSNAMNKPLEYWRSILPIKARFTMYSMLLMMIPVVIWYT